MPSPMPPTGPFTCEISLRRVRVPSFTREDRDGITYLTARDYEIAYETGLHFAGGQQLGVAPTG